jgi:hypothetical protein
VRIAALIGRQLAGQPERRRHRLGGGGGASCAGLAAKGAVDLTGITDSSLARLQAGSAVLLANNL